MTFVIVERHSDVQIIDVVNIIIIMLSEQVDYIQNVRKIQELCVLRFRSAFELPFQD